MAVKYLSGKRLQGTNAERVGVSSTTPASWFTSPDTDDVTTSKNANNRVGNKLETNNLLVGKTLTEVSFNIYLLSSYSGSNTASFKLYNGSTNAEKHNFGTFNISSLGTSAAKVTQNTAMGSGETVSAGDYIGIENNNTDSDIKVKRNYNSGGSESIPYAEEGAWNGSTYSSDPNTNVNMEVKYETSSPMATNIQTNSIFEESDTGKHYIWNATTSTWTEVA